MKTVLKVALGGLVVALVFSDLSVAEGGGDVFKAKCAMCHGASGAGDTGMGKAMNLRDLGSPDVQKQSDADLSGIITNGKGKMPKYDGKLTKEQIDSVVAFIRTLKN